MAIVINDVDEIILISNGFIPKEGLEEKLAYYGHNLGDHAAAAADNVLNSTSPWFERSVHHDLLTEAQVEQLRARASKLGMQTLTQLHTLAEQLTKDSQQSTEQTECESMKRFTCGVYFYSSDTSEAPQKK